MLRLSVLVCSCALALALGAAPALAQVGGCQRNRSWTTERLGKDHLKLTGQVEIDCGDQSFAADEVELFTDTHKLIATGNVVFTSGTNRIAADRLEYNTETRTGIFHNATGTATLEDKTGPPKERSMFGTSEPDVYFYGKTLEKIGREKYKITSGGFTTCVQPAPRWQLTSGTVLLNLEKHAILTNALFKVKDVPVLYLPVFYYPVNKEDRATGVLIPTYGTSTVRGQTISNAFFWAINRSQDATLLHDWYSTTGQGMGAEYRYMASPGSDGQIRFYNLREHEAEYTDDTGATVTTPERRSYEVRGTLSQRLGKRFRARGRADYFSDITVQQTYNQNIYDTSRRSRLYSGSVTGTVGTWNLSGAFDRNETFYGTTQSTVRGGTPKITAQRSDKPIFGSPAYFSMGVEAVNFTAQRKTTTSDVDNGLSRFDIFPRVRLPFTKWQFLTVSTSLAARYTYWTERKDTTTGLNLDDPISRNYFDLSAQVTGPTFNRIFNRTGSKYAEKIKHSIEPYFNVQRISPIDDFAQFVQIDGIDTIVGKVTRVAYGVNNRLFRKPGGGGRSTEMLTVALGQSYYTDARAAQYQTVLPDVERDRAEQVLAAVASGARLASGGHKRAVSRRVRHQIQGHPHDDSRRHRHPQRLVQLDLWVEPAPLHRGAVRLRRPQPAGSLSELGHFLEGTAQPHWRSVLLQLRRQDRAISAAAVVELLQRAVLRLCHRISRVRPERVQHDAPGPEGPTFQLLDYPRGHRVLLEFLRRPWRRHGHSAILKRATDVADLRWNHD